MLVFPTKAALYQTQRDALQLPVRYLGLLIKRNTVE